MNNAGLADLSQTNFTWLDWVIVAAYLMISVVIGLFVKRYATNMTNYIAAGRRVGRWLGLASLTGTELGLVTVMYSAEKGFKGGFAAFHIAVLAGITTLVIGLTGFLIVPLRKTGVLTIPEFYGRRFGPKTRVLGGILLAAGGILNMGLFLRVGSMFIVGVTGMSEHGWALPCVMTVLLTLVLVYTVLGGMISVLVTDYIQFVVLSLGMMIATGLAIANLGWSDIFEAVRVHKGAKGFDPLAADSTFGWEYVVWMAFLGIVSCAIWPTSVARALAMEDESAVKASFRWSSLSFTIRAMLPQFWGICAMVFFVTQAPQLAEAFGLTGSLPAGDKPIKALYAMPLFFGKLLPAGLIGLVSAAMIAAFMSTHDSYLLCWSSVIVQDIVDPLRKEPLGIAARVRLTRILIVVIGIYVWVWGLFYQGGDDVWDYMALTGAIYFTGAFAVLAGGLYWKRASSAGAACALLAGSSAVLGLEPIRVRLGLAWLRFSGEQATVEAAEKLLTSARVGIATVFLTVTVFVVVSLLFPDKASDPAGGENGETARALGGAS